MTVTINGTTGIAGVDGSAATPAVQGADTNTGVFYGTDIVAISTGGTEQVRVASAGQIGIGGANYGTSGQVLTSGGASAAPSWAAVSASGQLIRAPQILTSGTSYTTPANCTSIYVEVVGAGGGGGGSDNSNTSHVSAGGGGGAGAYGAKYFSVSPSTPYSYAIGGGGAAGTNTGGNGGTGGTSTFTVGATVLTSTGGVGGDGATANTSGDRGGGGSASNGDINGQGSSGEPASMYSITSTERQSGNGGSTFLGGGGKGRRASGAGAAGILGGGGSGACNLGTSGQLGGAGGAGFIRITEYT